jgi:hypothetical protein
MLLGYGVEWTKGSSSGDKGQLDELRCTGEGVRIKASACFFRLRRLDEDDMINESKDMMEGRYGFYWRAW